MSPEDLYLANEKLVYLTMEQRFPQLRNDEDLTQVGRIGLWKACRTYNAEVSRFSTYACKCIYTEICWELRHRNRRKYTAFKTVSLDEPIYGDTTLGELIAGKEDIMPFDSSGFLQALTPAERAILGYMSDGLKQTEIGKKLRISQGQVSKRISKIREKFKEFV